MRLQRPDDKEMQMGFLDVLKVVATALISLGGGGAIVWALSGVLGKVWINRIMQKDIRTHTEELDAIRHKYAEELGTLRHQFQIVQKQMSVIFESQKSSFTNVIKSMDKAIQTLEQPWDGYWTPIHERTYNEFHSVVVDESLFVGAEGEEALELFSSVLSGTVPWYDDIPDDELLRQSYNQLSFLSKRITEYFRIRVGLPGRANPLDDIYVFGACRLLNECYRHDEHFKSSILAYKKDQNTEQLISKARANMSVLREWLNRMIKEIESEDERSWRFQQALRAKHYLGVVGE
jgi:hypothetical protein